MTDQLDVSSQKAKLVKLTIPCLLLAASDGFIYFLYGLNSWF